MMGNGETWFDYKDQKIKNLRLYEKQVKEVEEYRLITWIFEDTDGELEYFFFRAERDNSHLGMSDLFRDELRGLEAPLAKLFEEERELTNPTPEEILMEKEQ